MTSVVIVDDHPLFSERLATFVGQQRDCTVVGMAVDATTGLELVTAVRPDLALIDIGLPDETGLWLCERIVERGLGVQVLMMSEGEPQEYAQAAHGAGAIAYVMKTAITRDLPIFLPLPTSESHAAPARSGRSVGIINQPAAPIAMSLVRFPSVSVSNDTRSLAASLAVVGGGIVLERPVLGIAGAAAVLLLSLWQSSFPAPLAAARVSEHCGGWRSPAQKSSVGAAAGQSVGDTPRGETVMQRFMEFWGRIVREEEGQDLVEYALLVAFIALVALAGVTAAGISISSLFSDVAAALDSVPTP